jgi:hypothetical protein
VNTPRERDQALEQWLQRSGSAPTAPTDACLDAETAAAWADDALRGVALQRAQQHVAGCARCQAVMASLTRATFATNPATAGARSIWQHWLTWGVPFATAAAALVAIAVWLNVPSPDSRKARTEASGAANTATASASSQSPPSTTQTQTQTQTQASAPEVSSPVEQRYDRAPAGPQRRTAQPAREPQTQQAPKELSAPAAPPESARVPAPAPRALSAQTAAAAAGDAPAAQRLERFALDSSVGTIEVPSPVPNVRWRVTGSTVEKTVDAGSTWTTTPTGAPASILAGSAPGPLVCWLVGRGGAVLLTADGVRWSRPVFPQTIDLVAVAATDARAAVVTTADGRRFRTDDGGRSWALQEN